MTDNPLILQSGFQAITAQLCEKSLNLGELRKHPIRMGK